jgi:hypothetical protein
MREICQSGFDERGEETELGQTGLRRRGESSATCHREATVTAPLLDSTLSTFIVRRMHRDCALLYRTLFRIDRLSKYGESLRVPRRTSLE